MRVVRSRCFGLALKKSTRGTKSNATSPEKSAAELRHRYPDHVTVMPYIGRHGWNSVRVDGTIPEEELREIVDESYEAIVAKLPKRLRP